MINYYDNVNDPSTYVKLTPKLFNKWSIWARTYKQKEDGTIKEFGLHIGPDWEKTEFKDLDDFYRYYIELVEEE